MRDGVEILAAVAQLVFSCEGFHDSEGALWGLSNQGGRSVKSKGLFKFSRRVLGRSLARVGAPKERVLIKGLAHRNRSDFRDFCDCDAHRGPCRTKNTAT